MRKVVAITVRRLMRQARAYLLVHWAMLTRPREFGASLMPGDTTQFFRAFANIGVSGSLFVIAAKFSASHSPKYDGFNPSLSQGLFVAIIFLIVESIPLAVFLWYCGLNSHRFQTALAFSLNWMSCMLFTISIPFIAFLLMFGVNPNNVTINYTYFFVFGLAVLYGYYLMRCMWIAGMAGAGRLHRGIGEAYVFFLLAPLVIGKAEEYTSMIHHTVSPFFNLLP